MEDFQVLTWARGLVTVVILAMGCLDASGVNAQVKGVPISPIPISPIPISPIPISPIPISPIPSKRYIWTAPPPPPENVSPSAAVIVALCLNAEDLSGQCVEGDLKGAMDEFARFLIEELMTKTATNMLVALISVRYPAQVEWAEQKESLVELHAKVTNLAVARMRADGAKLQPFPHQSFEQKQQNLAIIAASNNNIFEFERKRLC